ncbi:ABC transporter, ATPase subunit [Candidatus Koribacter versatilis Ellin345]|uniref:ABC transporter, ATPase subunit n=1 Tax=Koribacter versatilis (strain Ellin345) TaxID=204669 RepID=Q1IP28_KORVE|nr:ABC transporter ATP-binding protein [Candidatus Koribacter versatilis]ABF41372.1 ABC transporter, ATPase subunit [Candidatus Koribacter versatilis Ellin345]
MAQHEEEQLGKAYDSRLMKRLLGYLRPYQWQVYVAIAAIILKAGADVVGPVLTQVAIDKYLAKRSVSHLFDRFLSVNPLTGIGQIAGLYVILLLLSFAFEYAQTYLMQWVGQKAMFDMRAEIFRHLQRLHIGFFDKNPVGRLVTRVTSDVDALNEMFTSGVVSIVEDVFVLSGIMYVMLRMNWRLALLVFAVLPIITWATGIFRRAVRDAYRKIRVAIARINSYLQEHITGIVVLQLFNREKRSYDKFEEVNRAHMDAFKDAIMAHAVYYPIVEFLSAVAIASVIWFGGGQFLRNAPGISIGILVAFIQYSQRFFRPIQDFSEKYNIVQQAMAACERIFKLLDTPVEIDELAQPKSATGSGRIEFDHVWFAYRKDPNKNDEWDWVLRDVSFTLEPGETVAVVGHTGAGKTTLISLLLRFYDVQQGAIKIDGIDIREMSLADLRRRYGVVLQDPFLFTGTIGENIRLGTEWITDEQMMKAAEEVNVAEFIRSQPAGFEQGVHERGSTLSTGQKQLISFARALAHNPKILILDEATSSVDTETEFRVRAALSKLVEGRTSLIIAHRLSTIQRADKIIVMHKGKVREMGSHQQLLAQRGIYYKLYQLQYKDQELPLAPTLSPATD